MKKVEKVVKYLNKRSLELEKNCQTYRGCIEIKINPFIGLFLNSDKLASGIRAKLIDFRMEVDGVTVLWNSLRVFYCYEDSPEIPRYGNGK